MGLSVKVLRKPEVAELGNEKVMVDFESGKYFMLKGVANDIWELLQDGIEVSSIVKQLLEEYDVDDKTCTKSVVSFLKTLEGKGFIQLVG